MTLCHVSIMPLAVVSTASAQTVAARFTTGDRDLVVLTFTTRASQTLPREITVQSGSVHPVVHLGQPMLRVAERTPLLVHLPEVLPQDFTLEFDIVPKTCCLPEDLAVEGTRTIDQGTTSANVLWHRDQLMVVGGDSTNYHGKVPESLAATLPGALTHVVLIVQGDNMTLLTNGQQLFSLTNRKFVRDSILRVFLGGQNDLERAVYLARLRVIANAAPVQPVAIRSAAVSSRSFDLAGFVGSGASVRVASRTLPLAGFTGHGLGISVASRTLTLAGFAAAGASASIASRAIPLAGFTADGLGVSVASRTITLAGFGASGSAAPIASRAITLAGWTAAGPP